LSRGDASGGGESRPRRGSGADPGLVRHEEELQVGSAWEEVGGVRVRRETTTQTVSEQFPRRLEDVEHERVPVENGDSGEIEVLPDGSVSIPLFEEQLVVTRRQVLRERVIVRKHLVTEWETVEAELRREEVEVEGAEPTGAEEA
jgi:uncharacterized protein (TIGR02271 family)